MRGRVMWRVNYARFEPASIRQKRIGRRAAANRPKREVRRHPPQAPTLAEARAFIGDYEAERGASFSAAERQLCGACFAYSCAYTARCGHALGGDERGELGTFQHLAWAERENLLLL